MFESYTINNRKIHQKIGRIEEITNSFVWEVGISSNFIRRRSNFHGLKLKGMTQFTGTLMNAKSSYVDEAPYNESIQAFQVEDYTYGVFNDVLKFLEHHFNFSTILYKRRKKSVGDLLSSV